MEFSINGAGTTGYPCGKKIKLDSYFTSYIKINSRWTEDNIGE